VLGNGGTTDRSVPTPVSTALVSKWQTVTAGGYHTCGLSTKGIAYCWGKYHGIVGGPLLFLILQPLTDFP
jgi:hypothetical protein